MAAELEHHMPGTRSIIYGDEVLGNMAEMDQLVTVTVNLDFTTNEREWLAADTGACKENVWDRTTGSGRNCDAAPSDDH